MYAVKNPYKPLFILGVLFGLMGVLIWLFFDVGLIAFYPRRAHIQIMFFAFFWSFVAGFLMTAIPHMTDSRLTCSLEVWLASSLVLVQFILNFFNRTDLAVFFYFIQLIFLLFFILSRF